MEYTVLVWSDPVKVHAYQRSKSVWVAQGEYLGQGIEVTGRTATSAVKLWRETARYRGG